MEGLKERSEEGARLGYTGKQIIHPIQIGIVQDAFLPSQEKIQWATQLLAEFQNFQSKGKVILRYISALRFDFEGRNDHFREHLCLEIK